MTTPPANEDAEDQRHAAGPGGPVGAATWVGFVAMCVGMFMAILDIQIVASSLVAIGNGLSIRPDHLSWIQTAYLIAEVVGIPLTGWLTRAFSLRLLFVGATLGFTLASVGCALSTGFAMMVTIRAIQGLFGGLLIPAVFTSVFTMFPASRHVLATAIAGSFAMVAPTIGPALGGYLSETTSWHWMFLINLPPGLVVAAVVTRFVHIGAPHWPALRRIGIAAVIAATIFLGALELLLKEGPRNGWGGAFVLSLLAICPVAAVVTLRLCQTRKDPFVDLTRFRDAAFSAGCALSFVLGIGLYGSTYLLAVFLGLVRDLGPIGIGTIMIVTGAAQLLTAPVATVVEPRVSARGLTAVGFAVFAAGLVANGFTTPAAGFAELFWPQVLRGASLMLCLLPATRLALDGWPSDDAAEASGVFNLMRNLGGAIGIALIDTILEQRTPVHVAAIVERLQAGDAGMARFVGLPAERFQGKPMEPVDEATRETIRPLVEAAGLTTSINEAWIAIGIAFALAVCVVPFIPRRRRGVPS